MITILHRRELDGFSLAKILALERYLIASK